LVWVDVPDLAAFFGAEAPSARPAHVPSAQYASSSQSACSAHVEPTPLAQNAPPSSAANSAGSSAIFCSFAPLQPMCEVKAWWGPGESTTASELIDMLFLPAEVIFSRISKEFLKAFHCFSYILLKNIEMVYIN